MRDEGEVVTAIVVGVASVGATGAVVAVSDAQLNNAQFVLVIFGIISGLLAVATWLNRRWNNALESRIKAALEDRTKPIQPDANGGKSLADLHHKIDANAQADQLWRLGVQSMMQDFANRLDRIEGEERL